LKLLVSVADAADARAAVAGGADVIDAKDPTHGALSPVRPAVLEAIVAAVGGARPVSAALGETAADHALAGRAGALGLAFVKIGLTPDGTAEPRARAVVRDAVGSRVVLAAYADQGLDPWAVIDLAARVGAAGVLLDTADKSGPGLFQIMDHAALGAWVASARQEGLMTAVAGRLSIDDLARVAELGADVAGVRGAACQGTRAGRVSTERVRALAVAAQWPARSAWNAGEPRTSV
jgi:(5-formylfuran-3-yl)methyl phosphate synthase